SKQPCTSPIMSKGPCSCLRLFHRGSRWTTAASTSSGEERTKTLRNPSRSSPLNDRRNCWLCWRMTCGPKSRFSRERLRSRQSFSGKFRTIATGKQWYSRARANTIVCPWRLRSEEHTSELQSRFDIVCRLLLEKKKKTQTQVPVLLNTLFN